VMTLSAASRTHGDGFALAAMSKCAAEWPSEQAMGEDTILQPATYHLAPGRQE